MLYNLNKSDLARRMADGVTDLLGELGIADRYAAAGEEILEPDLAQTIDYEKVQQTLGQLRSQSVSFLQESLAGKLEDASA